jgi:hypothetical protein
MPANTSPDNIQFPTAGDQVAPLNTVFQNLAETTQTALAPRASFSYRWADAAARTAQAGMRNGDQGYQIDTGLWYERIAAAWVRSSGVWSSFASALVGSVTNPNLGTGGSMNMRFCQVGKLVTVHFAVQFGSSGVAPGSGSYSISLPVAAATIVPARVGLARAFDS